MYKVEIKDLSGAVTHVAKFETLVIAQEWINKQKSKGEKCAWGRPAYSETLEDGTIVATPDQFSIEIIDIKKEKENLDLELDKVDKLKKKFKKGDNIDAQDINKAIAVILERLF